MQKLFPQLFGRRLLMGAAVLLVGAFSGKSYGQLLLIENFNDIPVGSVVANDPNTQWVSVAMPTAGPQNVVDTGPATPLDHALTNTTGNNGAKISTLTPVGDVTNPVGTLFFRANLSNFSAGVSFGLGTTGINDFSGYNTQLSFTGAGAFIALDGGTQKTLNNVSLSLNTWYNIWVVADNSANTWTAYIQGGSIGSLTQLSASGDSDFAFRNTAAGTINTFMFARGGGTANTAYLDDIYFGLGNLAGTNPIPEPSSIALLVLSVFAAGARRVWSAIRLS